MSKNKTKSSNKKTQKEEAPISLGNDKLESLIIFLRFVLMNFILRNSSFLFLISSISGLSKSDFIENKEDYSDFSRQSKHNFKHQN